MIRLRPRTRDELGADDYYDGTSSRADVDPNNRDKERTELDALSTLLDSTTNKALGSSKSGRNIHTADEVREVTKLDPAHHDGSPKKR